MNSFTSLIQTLLLMSGMSMASAVDYEVPTTACNFQSMAALGDSYSAGLQGINTTLLPICSFIEKGFYSPWCTTRKCGRNRAAYSWQFMTNQKVGSYGFFACSGYNSSQIYHESLSIQGTPDLITLTLGGNNNGAFGNAVEHCVYLYNSTKCDQYLAIANATIASIDGALDQVLSQGLRPRYRKALIAVMSYVKFYSATPLNSTCQGLTYKPTDLQKASMNALVDQMNIKLHQAAKRALAVFIDGDALFQGNRFCEPSGAPPYFHYRLFDNTTRDHFDRAVFHPTETGQTLYLVALQKALGCSLGKTDNTQLSLLEVQMEL